jgi:hypothetical protein
MLGSSPCFQRRSVSLPTGELEDGVATYQSSLISLGYLGELFHGSGASQASPSGIGKCRRPTVIAKYWWYLMDQAPSKVKVIHPRLALMSPWVNASWENAACSSPAEPLLLACDVFVAPIKEWIRKQFVVLVAAHIYHKFAFLLRLRYSVKNVQGDPSPHEKIKVSVD